MKQINWYIQPFITVEDMYKHTDVAVFINNIITVQDMGTHSLIRMMDGNVVETRMDFDTVLNEVLINVNPEEDE